MKKRIPLLLLMLISAGSLYLGTAPDEVYAQSSDSLAPVVFIGLDTSGSMDSSFGDEGNTRWTRAIQELSGKALGSSNNVGGSSTRYPRKMLVCSGGLCDYKTKWVCGSSFKNNSTNKKDAELVNCETVGSGTNRNLKDFKVKDPSEFASTNYVNNGVLHEYLNIAKFGFVGMAGYGSGATVEVAKSYPGDQSNMSYGKTRDGNDKIKGARYYGVYNINITNTAPTAYPTPSDDPAIIRKSNDMVISNIRSYSYGSSSTPLEPLLTSVFGIMNPDEPDLGLMQQPKPGATYTGNSVPSDDTHWVTDSMHNYKCRKKAVIAMTDGAPNVWNATSSSNYKNDLFNTLHNFHDKDIEVYPILYAQKESSVTRSNSLTNVTSMDSVMNLISWKGGTCREFGHTGEIIDPNNEAGYKAYLAGYTSSDPNVKKQYTSCYYNAFDGGALTNAVKAIMNQILAGYKSKSRMVLTTHVGSETVKKGDQPTNGWYNIYTGYKTEYGNLRTTGLRREAYVCTSNGFEHDPDLSRNIAKIYAERFAACRAETKIHASEYKTNGNREGKCKEDHLILVGDYSESNRFNVMPDMISITDSKAGVIKYKKNSAYDYYRFFDYEQSAKDDNSFTNTVNNTIGVYFNDYISQYMISPYECAVDSDCIPQAIGDAESYICDMGKCIVRNNELKSCMSANCAAGQFCIKGQCRAANTDSGKKTCSSHSQCVGDNKVCHAGKCVTGVLTNGDVRDLIASLPLGTIEFGAPTVVPPPKLAYTNEGYTAFKGKYGDRDTMLYAPANDGLLHAFVLGRNNTKENYSKISGISNSGLNVSDALEMEGQEVWSFMPKGVMRDIHTLTTLGVQNKLNVTPVYADLVFGVDDDGINDWRSVLVGGFGGEGRGYYALDVTEPAKPKILWEIDHQWQASGSDYPAVNVHGKTSASNENDNAPFSRLGYSRPAAALTNMWLDGVLTPVAILAGGFPLDNAEANDIEGKAVYIVKLNPKNKEDLLVAKFNFDTAITGTPAVFPSGFNSSAEVIYVGDNKGALHRIDISHKSIMSKSGEDTCADDQKDCWTVNGQNLKRTGSGGKTFNVAANKIYPIFDPNLIDDLNPNNGTYERVTYKPALNAVGSTGRDIQIAIGSGDNTDNAITAQQLNYAGVFIDHYVNDEIGYKLNNFNSNKKASSSKDAYTQKIKPVVIVFNPTSDIHSDDAKSRNTYGDVNDKQYFEIIAGHLTNNDLEDPVPPTGDQLECDARCAYSPDGVCSIDNVSYSAPQAGCYAEKQEKECKNLNGKGTCPSGCEYQNSFWTGNEGCHWWSADAGLICSGCEMPVIKTEKTCHPETHASFIESAAVFLLGGWLNWIIKGQSPSEVVKLLKDKCKNANYMVDGVCYATENHDYDIDSCDKPGCCDSKSKSKSRSGAARSGGNSSSTPSSSSIGARQKMFGPAVTYNYRTYFPTFNSIDPASESCSDGFASIWLVNALTDESLRWGSGVTEKTKNQSTYANLTGATDDGKLESALDGSKRVSFVNMQNGTIVYELMFTPQLSCINGNKVSYVSPMLVAQTGGAAGISGSHAAKDDIFGGSGSDVGAIDQNINITAITEQMLGSVSMPSSWGSVYE